MVLRVRRKTVCDNPSSALGCPQLSDPIITTNGVYNHVSLEYFTLLRCGKRGRSLSHDDVHLDWKDTVKKNQFLMQSLRHTPPILVALDIGKFDFSDL